MTDSDMYVSEVAELFPRQGLWTEADYLRLPHASRVVELCAGRLMVYPPAPHDHQRIAGDFAIALDRFVDERKLGEVLFAPLAVRLSLNLIRMPDLVFIGRGHEHRKRKMWIEGPPDLVAEVISPESRMTDEVDKLADYARSAIPEYWLIDPEQHTIRVYGLSDELPEYVLVGSFGPGTIAQSALLSGFQISVDQLF